jgi:branched-chain amino acid transport system ATP-binding protein
VLLDGAEVTGVSAAARASRGLGRTFQDARLFPSMTVAEVLATALERHLDVREPTAYVFRFDAALQCEADVRHTVGELLDLMNLGRYRDAFVGELSTGTRRIVELACALAHAPRVLLLDEPSAGIAQREVEALRDVLLQVRRDTGAALAVVEHDIPLLSSMCDSMVCMHLGRVIATGTPEAVLADPLVVSSYLGTDTTAIQRSGSGSRRVRTAAGATS